jgi:hypothetical protein
MPPQNRQEALDLLRMGVAPPNHPFYGSYRTADITRTQPPAAWTPDVFQRARQLIWENGPAAIQHLLSEHAFGQYFPLRNAGIFNTAYAPPTTPSHEVGHAIYGDSPEVQAPWTGEKYRQWQGLIARHMNTPGNVLFDADPNESFARTWSWYVTSPQALQNKYPDVYNFMKNLSGFEYTRRK